jgi:hypothetical protein
LNFDETFVKAYKKIFFYIPIYMFQEYIEYVNIGLIVVTLILLAAFIITLSTGAQKDKEKFYAPNVPVNMGNGRVKFITST